MSRATDLACAIHVHSRHSDGSGTIAEIAAAAARAGVDVVLVTDHDTLAGRAEQGWYGDVLVLVGVELSPKRRDHYLAFGLEREVAHDGLDAAAMCAAVDDAGGFGFAAHPFSSGSAMPVVRRFAQAQRWADLERPCLTGIEVWNVETGGAERARSPRELWAFLRDPLAAFAEPDPADLRAWDELSARRRTVGIAGLDAHAKALRIARRTFAPLSYEHIFRHVRTHLLVDQPLTRELAHDRALVFDALRSGRAYMAVDSHAGASGFHFSARRGRDRLAMGGEADAEPGWAARVEAPRSARLTLLRDGVAIAQADARDLDADLEGRGVYRVEARIDGRLWVASNPIHLR